MRRFLEAAWWFLLGACLMHFISAYVLFEVLRQPSAQTATASFFLLEIVALAALILVGIILVVSFLKRRLARSK